MPHITEAICTGNRRYPLAPYLKPQGIVVHSIGVTQPDAEVLRRFWQDDRSPYVVHYMVDDVKILHTFPDNKQCWHVGSPGNAKWLGVEVGETNWIQSKNIKIGTGGGFTIKDYGKAVAYTEAAYRNVVWLCAVKCKEYGWDPFTAVWTHYEISRQRLSNTDHIDPQHIWDGLGMGLNLLQLRRDVAKQMGLTVSAPAPVPAHSKDELYRIRKSWADAGSQIGAYKNLEYAIAACKPGYAVYDTAGRQVHPPVSRMVRVTASALNVRRGPATTYAVVNTIAQGGAYTIVEEVDGWGLLKSYQRDRNGWVSLQYTEPV